MPVIDCVALAEKKRKEYEDAGKLKDRACLHIIQIGENQVNELYMKSKIAESEKWNVDVVVDRFSGNYIQEIRKHIQELNFDDSVDGIIIQSPTGLSEDAEQMLFDSVCTWKDVDGLKRDHIFMPCTPKGIMWLLEDIGYENKIIGIIGRGKLVGRPLIDMLRDKPCTLVLMNSSTQVNQMRDFIDRCDIVISAVGKPEYLRMKWFETIGHTVIDAGISRVDGKQVGDFEHGDVFFNNYFDVRYLIDYTPWTKGVGKLTVAALMSNVRDAHYENSKGDN